MVIYAVHPIIYGPTPIKPSYQSVFCLNNRSIIAIKSRFWNRG